MLPGLGFSEIVVLALITLLVVQPKDLPALLRTLGRWTRKMQAMAAEFRQGFDELARQTELDELRKEVDALRRTANPFSDIQREVSGLHADVMRPIDPAETAPPEPAAKAPDETIPENFDVQPTPPTPAIPEEEPAPPRPVEARG